MNKKQWKEERRKYRLILKSILPHPTIRDKNDIEYIENTLFDLVYNKLIPQWYFNQRKSSWRHVYKYESSTIAGKLNVETAPNSYPHSTRNP